MKTHKYIVLIFVVVCTIAGCKNGRPIKRNDLTVISLAPSITKMICHLGRMDCLVGVTDYCKFDMSFENLIKEGRIQRVSGFNSFNYERLLALSPRYVFYLDSITLGDKQHLEDIFAGSRTELVAMVHPSDFEEIKSQFAFIGKYLSAETQAEQACAEIDRRLSRIKPLPKKITVLAEIFYPPYTTVGRHTFIADMIVKSGASLAFSGEANWPVITVEDIIAMNPDVVITMYGSKNVDKNLLLIDAYKNGRIFTPSNIDYFMQPGIESADICLELNEYLLRQCAMSRE